VTGGHQQIADTLGVRAGGTTNLQAVAAFQK
jgi:hypothetical protein